MARVAASIATGHTIVLRRLGEQTAGLQMGRHSGIQGCDGLRVAGARADSLREPARRKDATIFSEYNLTTPNAKYMVRHGKFKYVYYMNDIDQLFDLQDDPHETGNLARLPRYKKIVEDMRARLFAWYRPPETAETRR